MRLGVSGKILVAYTAMAVVFVGSSALTLVYMHRTRERIEASQLLFDLQADVDASWRALDQFPARSTRRPDPQRALTFVRAQASLEAALDAIDRYLETAPQLPDPPEMRRYRRQLAELSLRLAQVAAGLAHFEASQDEDEQLAFISQLTTLTSRLDRVKRVVRADNRRIAAQLSTDEESARSLAMALGLLGLVVAVLVAGSIMRTLRPLRVLRQRAREVAGGDYGRRVNVESRDEIGELAREFDAMAIAIKEREQRLIQSERLATIGQMAAHITHEVRNPLAAIGLNAELLGDEIGPDNREARRLVTAIVGEVDRLSDISETYLKFVRMPRAERTREDLGAIATSVLEFARAELERSGITLTIAVAPDVPDVAADESQLRQALLNLVRNAREAMATGGRLEVEVERDPAGRALLRLRDSGPGIAPEHLGRIFDPFFSTKAKGTGLGLPLVQQIVNEHGGRIRVENVAAGGTRFEIVLPPLPGARVTPADESVSESAGLSPAPLVPGSGTS